MKTGNCRKLLLPLLLLILLFSIGKVSALEITNRSELKIDEQLSDNSQLLFTQPKKIHITQVKGYDSKLSNDSSKWIKLLHYYSVTRLKLQDIPYNYLVDESGNIFEGRSGGAGSNPCLSNGENVVMIGYLSSNTMLTPRASTAIQSLVEDLSYKYGIKDGNWSTVSLSINQSEGEISLLSAEIVGKGTFADSVSESLEDVNWSDKEHLEYKATIEGVEYSKDVVIGETLKVVVKVKNENDFTWFADSDYIYVSTKDSKDSPYAINSVWDSFSKPGHLESDFVKPGEVAEIAFELLAKSKPGSYSAEFNLMKSPNSVFENSEFKVEFNIGAGSYKLVEMSSPDYGFVNIRECRWYSCEKVEVANDGDVFITTKKEEGWYEIEYKKGSKGWVYQKYVKAL